MKAHNENPSRSVSRAKTGCPVLVNKTGFSFPGLPPSMERMNPLAFTEDWNGVSLLVLAALGLAILLLAGLHRRMSVMERIVRQIALDSAESRPDGRKAKTVSEDRPYLRFLEENPDKQNLPKSELFAEYRKWRKQQGLNWEKR